MVTHKKDPTERLTVHLAAEIWYAKKERGKIFFKAEKDAAMTVDQQGKIVKVSSRTEVSQQVSEAVVTFIDHGNSYIVPGFIDAHLHCPQLDVIGSGGQPLLGWLDKFVFPAEAQFCHQTVAKAGAKRLTRELQRHGAQDICDRIRGQSRGKLGFSHWLECHCHWHKREEHRT